MWSIWTPWMMKGSKNLNGSSWILVGSPSLAGFSKYFFIVSNSIFVWQFFIWLPAHSCPGRSLRFVSLQPELLDIPGRVKVLSEHAGPGYCQILTGWDRPGRSKPIWPELSPLRIYLIIITITITITILNKERLLRLSLQWKLNQPT